jgi:PTH1 family peptidyl-tRNA hydrolase
MKAIVGLGNPGRQYERTPHNVGFAVADELARRAGCAWRSSPRFRAQLSRVRIGEQDALLVKPQTYMNLSGEAVALVLRYHACELADLVVVLDDADLDSGRLRLRADGGCGGHRGLESIIQAVGGEAFARVRVGIGRREGGLVDHVLAPLAAADYERMRQVIQRAADAVERLVGAGIQAAMNAFNTKPSDAGPTEETRG